MASLTDLLAKTVASAAQGVEIPSNVQSTVLNGLSDSVLKSLTQTATPRSPASSSPTIS